MNLLYMQVPILTVVHSVDFSTITTICTTDFRTITTIYANVLMILATLSCDQLLACGGQFWWVRGRHRAYWSSTQNTVVRVEDFLQEVLHHDF